MYLNDLLDALSRGEKPDLTKPELLSIFRKQRPLHVFQHVALFYKLLGPRVEGEETQIQRANRIGASKDDVKQHEGVMNWTTCKDYSQILDALCAGALLLAGGKEQSLSTSRLYSKLRNGRIRSITPKGNRWYIEF